jgi:hypothetical protein
MAAPTRKQLPDLAAIRALPASATSTATPIDSPVRTIPESPVQKP